MRLYLYIFLLIVSFGLVNAQQLIKVGDKAPTFLVNLQQNSIQSFSMPYLNRIVLLHFWSSTVSKSKQNNKFLNRLTGRYKNAMYRSAEGFEAVAIAVQSDKKAWTESITADSLTHFTNGIALRGYNDEVCKKFGVTQLPADILIDENGIVIAINPRMRDLENILDEKKNFIPIKKDVIGILAQSSNKNEVSAFTKMYLFDAYGDSIATARTNEKGFFSFSDIKLNQDFLLKVDNGIDIITSDPLALFTSKGEHLLDGKNMSGGFIFKIPSNLSYKLTEDNEDKTLTGNIEQVNVSKMLVFKPNGFDLLPKDETELLAIVQILSKNKALKVDVYAHTDAKSDPKAALELTGKQAQSVYNFLIKKGVEANRIKMLPKGNAQPRKTCTAKTDCDEADHKTNRRIEFIVYKN
ncbi:MAG: OmpA family protein [Bacteroidetes bacterium]|jgi:outer membrane protein OmpA-like peptidoglycan-associated protein|nr:OmpA family protein [Bacteroidota bacterium]MCA6443589.1 OmpA family protein [Bacteroidota bacterium]